MSFALMLGSWVATVWIHSTILSLAAITFAYFCGARHRELRDVVWKVALVGGIFTASLQSFLPGLDWRDVTLTADFGEPTSTSTLDADAPPVVAQTTRDSAPIATVSSATTLPPVLAPTNEVSRPDQSTTILSLVCMLLAAAFIAGLTVGCVRAALAMIQLSRMRQRSLPCQQSQLVGAVGRLCRQLGLRRRVELRESTEIIAPLAMGVASPCVLIPTEALDGRLDLQQIEGLLAHELAHHQRHDPLWALIAHTVSAGWWFQPLHLVVRNAMRSESEYLADALACRTLGEGLGLARCLAAMAEWLVPARMCRVQIGAVHLFVFRSSLKQRVETLLAGAALHPTIPRWRLLVRSAAIALLALLILAAPSIHIRVPYSSAVEPPMKHSLAALTLAATLSAPALAEETNAPVRVDTASEAAPQATIPASVHGFSGELRGTIVSKDTDGAKLVLKVETVTNVWKGNKAERPNDLVGLTVPVEKFFGRFLDVLLIVKPGDTVLLEAKHVRGEQLQFLGEVFKKVEAAGPSPTATPDKPQNSSAAVKSPSAKESGFPQGLTGFRGILVGKVVKTDSEKGVLVFEAESVKRTWPQNKATNPASSKGKQLTVNGISGKWLDVLLVLKPGDRIEVEAFHNRGEALDFVQEWLKKID